MNNNKTILTSFNPMIFFLKILYFFIACLTIVALINIKVYWLVGILFCLFTLECARKLKTTYF